MNKKIILLICQGLICWEISAACNTGAIEYGHSTGFGISFGSGGLKTNYNEAMTVNVPLSINDNPACFRKKSKMSLKAKNAKDIDKGSIVISPMKVEFENIPSAHEKQYLFVEKNADKGQTRFHIMSFVCSDEIPLSVEAASDSYIKIWVDSNKGEVKTSSMFAIGFAADNLAKARNALSSQGTFDFFEKLYDEKSSSEIPAPQSCLPKLPSIISETSVKIIGGIERAIVSSFTTLGAKVVNGCSKDFSRTMEAYLLENYERNESLKDYKISKKWFSDDLEFKWK